MLACYVAWWLVTYRQIPHFWCYLEVGGKVYLAAHNVAGAYVAEQFEQIL